MTAKEIESLAKDQASATKLKNVISQALRDKDRAEANLKLLEKAIKGDYDSILITELNVDQPGPKIVYVNDGFTRMTGYTKEEVIGKTPRILQGPKTDRTTLDRLKHSLIEGRSFFGQAVNYRKDGTEFVNQWDIHPLTDEKGNVTHWVSYQHDISARKSAELTFLEQDVEFDELYEYSKRTLLDVDQKGKVVAANKSFRELFQFNQNELKKMNVWEFFPPSKADKVRSYFDLFWDEAAFPDKVYGMVARTAEGNFVQLEVETKILNLSDHSILRFNIKNLSLQKRIMKTLTKRNKQFDAIFSRLN